LATSAEAYVQRQIDELRGMERKIETFCSFGRVPRVRGTKMPSGAEKSAAAARSGDIAAERMRWERALELLRARNCPTCGPMAPTIQHGPECAR